MSPVTPEPGDHGGSAGGPAAIVVTEGVWGEPFDELADRYAVRRLPAPSAADLAHARALVVRNKTQVTRELLQQAPLLEVVARAGAGVDNIDVEAAEELGVVVVAATGANAVSVAEHALAMALALARRITVLDADTKAGGWDRRPARELASGVWGLLSAGATARATGHLARGLGMSVVAYDPYVPDDHRELIDIGVKLLPLRDVVRQADVLSVHLPATAETSGIVDSTLLDQAKPSLLLISVGRGETIDEAAVTAALKDGRIAGAALDVRSHEPPVRGELENLPNVVLTPHVAGITAESQARVAEILCADISAVLDEREATHAVGRHRRPARTRGERVT